MGTAHATRSRASSRRVLPACRGSLPPGRSFVCDALRREGWGDEALGDVAIAVSEALTNAVEYGSEPGAPVVVEVAVRSRRARVRIVDEGRAGSCTPAPLRAAPPPSSVHGRGLIIMAALADALEVRRAGSGTEVRLAFSRARAPGPGRTA